MAAQDWVRRLKTIWKSDDLQGSSVSKLRREERKEYREAVRKYVNEELPKLSGFADFDEVDRLRINFPNGWRDSDPDKGK